MCMDTRIPGMDKRTLYHHVQGERFLEQRIAFKEQLVHGVMVSIPGTFVWPVIPSYGGGSLPSLN